MHSIQSFITGRWKENCYLVSNATREGLIIDPGNHSPELNEYLTQARIQPLAILNTHAHYDHVGAVSELKARWDIPFYLNSLDQKLLKQANFFRTLFDGDEKIILPSVDGFFDSLPHPFHIGGFEIKAFHTPGHTAGGVCIQIGDHLFTGDTLFKGEIGRADLPGGNLATLKKSLKVLGSMAPSLHLHPGHGKPTTLAEELVNNPQFQEALG